VICYKIREILKISGEHNVSNALAVYSLAKALGIKDRDIFNAIGSYRGAWRRMEYRGNFELRIKNNELGIKNDKKPIIHDSKFIIPIYDDYAHHPTEIKATLAGIAQKWPKTGLICVFQPHQAKRLSLLFKDFVGAFDKANALVLLPVYQVAGRDISDKLSQNRGCCNENKFRRKTSQIFCNNKIVAKYLSKKLAEAIKKRTNQLKTNKLKTIIYLPHPEKLLKILKEIIKNISVNQRTHQRQSAIIVMMGAGDIYTMTDKLVK
jgi:UDP-N-acetylmuramate-alanine ligase